MSGRWTAAAVTAGAALAAVLALAGCSAADDATPASSPAGVAGAPGAPAPSALATGGVLPPGAPGASAAPGGVSADQARSSGRFVAEYDAKVEAGRDQRRGGARVVTVTNVGTRDDSYVVSLSPPGSGTVTPTTVAAASGEGFQVLVTPTAATELVVVSRGRGAEVIRQPVTP